MASASLSVDRGQIVGLVGESGCGKSSLARAAVGLVARAAGEIVFDGAPLVPLRRGARPKSATRLQMVFQNPYSSLNPRRTIGSQVADGLRLAGESDRLVRRQRVAELLDKVGTVGRPRRAGSRISSAAASASASRSLVPSPPTRP